MFPQLGTEGIDLALGLGGCLPLILGQRGLQPLILLLQLVGIGQGSVKCLLGPLQGFTWGRMGRINKINCLPIWADF